MSEKETPAFDNANKLAYINRLESYCDHLESKCKELEEANCPKCGCNKMTGDGSKAWCLNEKCDFVDTNC